VTRTRMGNPLADLTVLVHDAHDSTRLGAGVALQRQPWIARCLLAADQPQAIELSRRHRPDVALVDISNAGPFAAALTRPLHEAHPAMRIVLTSRCSTSAGAPLPSLGAVGFLPPTATSAELGAAVRSAALGEPDLGSEPEDAPGTLTERERRVLTLISTGATNREIAAQLHVGPDSVKKTATAIYRKIGVRNRTEATRRAAAILAH
jgi:DNA-binding NarL/FixJ family response regulator